MADEKQGNAPDTAEGEKSSELSEKVPEEISGEGDTPWGTTDQHSDAPGPHGTGEVYPRGDRSEEEDSRPEDSSEEDRA